MKDHTLILRVGLAAVTLLGFPGSVPLGAAEGPPVPTGYTLQPILKQGDPLGNTPFTAGADFLIIGLSNQGQLLFTTPIQRTKMGTFNVYMKGVFLYDHGQCTLLVVPGGEAPIGRWPAKPAVWQASLSQRGNAAFRVDDFDLMGVFQPSWVGTFRWDHQAGQFIPVALPGMAAGPDLTLPKDTPYSGEAKGCVINASNEVAFSTTIREGTGKVLGTGALFLGREGQLTPLVLPGQSLPDGRKVKNAYVSSLNDMGRIALLIEAVGRNGLSAYVWEQGTLTPVAVVVTTPVAEGGRITNVWKAEVNNQNRNVLMVATVSGNPYGSLYLWREGQLQTVAVHDRDMPGGGTFVGINEPSHDVDVGLSRANDAGQHAFMARIKEEGAFRTAAYLMQPEGTLSLILKSGAPSDLGPISNVGWVDSSGVGLNNQGQVALPVKIDHGPSILALLTPTLP